MHIIFCISPIFSFIKRRVNPCYVLHTSHFTLINKLCVQTENGKLKPASSQPPAASIALKWIYMCIQYYYIKWTTFWLLKWEKVIFFRFSRKWTGFLNLLVNEMRLKIVRVHSSSVKTVNIVTFKNILCLIEYMPAILRLCAVCTGTGFIHI